MPLYLSKYILEGNHSDNTWLNEGGLTTYHCRTGFSDIHFFPHTISEWTKLDLHLCKAKSLLSFKNALLKTGQLVSSPFFNIYNPVGLKLLTRLQVGLCHLSEHKFKHYFSNCVNPLCSCSLEVESTNLFSAHFLTFVKSSLLQIIQYVIILLIFQIPVRLIYFYMEIPT